MEQIATPRTGAPIILAIGGSLVSPNGIDTQFVSAIRDMLAGYVAQGFAFIIIVGGGTLARSYQHALGEIGAINQDDCDWIGIYATHLNAHLMRLALGELAAEEIITDPTTITNTPQAPIRIVGGWKPGWSTDYVATVLARELASDVVVNLSNVDYIYTKDPNKHADAQPLTSISWEELEQLVPQKWEPGAQVPFDPSAIQQAKESALTMVSLNGAHLDQLVSYFDSGTVAGTIIHS